LATLLAKHGVASFWFNYSGIWGNSGKYTFSNSVADLKAAVDYLRSPDAKSRFDLGEAPIVFKRSANGRPPSPLSSNVGQAFRIKSRPNAEQK
jgi:hypothetical protein